MIKEDPTGDLGVPVCAVPCGHLPRVRPHRAAIGHTTGHATGMASHQCSSAPAPACPKPAGEAQGKIKTLLRHRTIKLIKRKLSSFVDFHGEESSELRSQITQLREYLREQKRGKRFVLHPEKNVFLGRWDLFTSAALIYTATVTPFETSFIPPTLGPDCWTDPWFLVNRTLDVIFSLDMILQFFVAFQRGTAHGVTLWIDDHSQVIRHYLTGWFFLDAFTVFVPMGFDIYLASDAFDVSSDAAVAETVGLLRVLRVLRLIKLVRLIRASRALRELVIEPGRGSGMMYRTSSGVYPADTCVCAVHFSGLFERWKSRITISHATMTLLQCLFMLLFGAHWYACIIALQASLNSDIYATWLNRYQLCDRPAIAPTGLTNGPLDLCQGLTMEGWYLASFAWAAMIMTGTGGTDYYPSEASIPETLCVTVLVVLGAFIWTQVLALFCDVATNSNPTMTTFRQQLDSLNRFIQLHGLPATMARRMRAYFHQQKGVRVREDANTSLRFLSQPLQIEVVLHIHSKWLRAVWFIRDLDAPVKVRLAMAMRQRTLSPGEVLPNRHLYIISRGSFFFGGRVLVRDNWWGDDVILANSRHCLPYLARAITYGDVSYISRDTFMETVEPYQRSMTRLRKSAIFLAVRREIILRAKEEMGLDRNAILKDVKSSVDREPSVGFLERFKSAVATQHMDSTESSINIALEMDINQDSSTAANDNQQSFTMRNQNGALRRLLDGQAKQQAAIDSITKQLQAITDHLGLHKKAEPVGLSLFWA